MRAVHPTYRVASGVLQHLLPIEAGKNPETLRGHTLKAGEQLRDAAVKPAPAAYVLAAPIPKAPPLSKTRCGRESYQEWRAKAIPKTIVYRIGFWLPGEARIS